MTSTGDTVSLSRMIKERAFAEGFDKVGIVRAARLDTEGKLLEQWLARHYHANMKWMERDPSNRVDPREIFPAARTVIVVAINYYTPSTHQDSNQTGKVSRYAWGDDYHEIVSTKLRSLLNWIKEQTPGAEGKVCVDIQPMMDKAWAVRAGLGWLGKHSNVITHEFGSWVFIGELLLNIELEYDEETVEDHCGTCTLCIDACPTGAIVEPYVVDSNRCISYATIELREHEIASPLAERLSGWFYGCDICQDVCPWNRFEQTTNEKRFEPREENINPNLTDILELTPDTYARRFRGSSMKRAKLSGLQRNARTLLNSGSRG
ncbi:MAG TPA: tRNA epoxyqueuosine(34) reductase QueG [Pyrinomonadaceae bacterium]